ncbi:MAG TPA: YidC/Oxa1 family insertase periplasmic-domain containing protein [Thermoguttaceae bacterium]
MERRFVLFLVLAFAIFAAYSALIPKLLPPPPPKAQANRQVAAEKDAKKIAPEKEPQKEKEPAEPDAKPQSAELQSEKTPPTLEKAPEKSPEVKAPEAGLAQEPTVEEEWVTLGSADNNDPYRMLATLTNRGAALARVELNNHRYRDIDDRSGYLGHLIMDKTIQGAGCPVQVVGAGTPADKAGIKVGDVIKAVNGKPVTSYASLQGDKGVLSKTRPGQTIQLAVLRNGEEMILPARLTRHPLSVVSPEDNDPLSFLLTMQQIGDERIPNDEEYKPDDKDKDLKWKINLERELNGLKLRSTNWQKVEADQTHVVFAKKLPKYEIEIFKTYSLVKVPNDSISDPDFKAFHLQLEIKIFNQGEKPQKVAYRLDGANGLPKEGWWYANKVSRNWSAAGLRDVVVSFEQNVPSMVGCPTIAQDKAGSPWLDQALTFIGVDAQYFSVVMIPQMEKPNDIWFATSQPLRVGSAEQNHLNLTNTSFRVTSLPQDLKPGQEFLHKFNVFAGPKRPPLLNQYGLSELVYYGWPIYAGPAVFLSWILHGFYFVVQNYGLSIILLTVLVRGCMFPLSIKMALGQQKMQELQPEIKRIAEKYKNDMEARSKAQQELFRKHNYNPFGGCLVLFIQLPIMLGLYKSLMIDIELRDAPLISSAVRWCSNLAAPDMLFNWSPFMPEFVTSGGTLLGLGPYFNLLPILTVILFVWQQKKTMPPPADEQAAMQQKIMQYMMIFIGIMFFKVASGLCIYFIASTLWGVAERKFLPKTKPAAGATPSAKTSARSAASVAGDDVRGKKNRRKR